MASFILFIVMAVIAFGAYELSRQHFLSPTFLSSISFAITSLEYYIFMGRIGRDISWQLFFVVTATEATVAIGELFAELFVISKGKMTLERKNIREFLSVDDINVSMKTTLFLTAIIFIVAIARYIRMMRFGGYGGLTIVVASIRYDFTRGKYSYGPVLAIMYYFAQFIAYIYALLFVYKLKLTKKVRIYLLLPVFGYCICAITTTSRSEYIKLACAFFAAVLVCNALKGRRKINFAKVGVFCTLFVAFFLWYGYAIRGITFSSSNSIVDNIVSYSCASLYGFDELLYSAVQKTSMFGENTLRNVYSFFGEKVGIDYQKTYYMQNMSSNIYTWLDFTYIDFGIVGLCVTRFMLAFLVVKLQKWFFRTSFRSYLFYFIFIVVCHNVYIFLMAAIGDKTYIFYLYPKYLLELLVGGILAFLFGLRFSFKKSSSIINLKGSLQIRIWRN